MIIVDVLVAVVITFFIGHLLYELRSRARRIHREINGQMRISERAARKKKKYNVAVHIGLALGTLVAGLILWFAYSDFMTPEYVRRNSLERYQTGGK